MCAGISLYGVASSSGDETRLYLDLRPALALKAKVVLIRDVPKGEFVGYGRAYQTPMDSQIAILPIGYADGLPINLSGAEASGDRRLPAILVCSKSKSHSNTA